jgi:high-affinity iron transporter
MLQAFVITLREGLEAFLIVAISLAYLRKSGRRELIPAVHWGIALSIFISIGAAYLFHRASNHALWEGLLAVIAAVSRLHRAHGARAADQEIEGHLSARR